MDELEYTGPVTIDTPPPSIPGTELGVVPTPLAPASLLGNLREKATTNGTFELLTAITVTGTESKVMRLHEGTRANMAIILCEAHEDAEAGAIIARFWQDGSFPTPTNGLHFKDGGVIEIRGAENVENFRIITADELPHRIQVQYFS